MYRTRRSGSQIDLRVGAASHERAYPREAKVAGAVGTVCGPLVAFDDGEGGVDVADIVPIRDAVEVEVERVQLGA